MVKNNKYPLNWNSEIRPRILKRDGYTCQHCNRKEKQMYFDFDKMKYIETKLHICHLDHDCTNLNIKDKRLLTLCSMCHLKYDYLDNLMKRKDTIKYNQLNNNIKDFDFSNVKIGKVVKRMRIKLDISVKRISNELGISKVTYWKMETGQQEIRMNQLNKLANIFECSWSYSCIGEEEELIFIKKY
jgi:DNA-binding Xre family transcriptional regulator